MKILLLGKDGQLGWALQSSLAIHGKVIACGRNECDLSNLDQLRSLVASCDPDVIVNAAAYTAVDRAESDLETAMRINRDVPAVLAELAGQRNLLLIHYSTDYVYDGQKKSPYLESDLPNPQSNYGLSKLAGENAVRATCARSVIFRTSWVFGSHGQNFVKTMLRLAWERSTLNVVADQVGSPTPAALIAEVTGVVLSRLGYGQGMMSGEKRLYHLSAANPVSWHGFAQHIVSLLDSHAGVTLRPEAIVAISSQEYPVPARRPANSCLDCTLLERDFALQMPDWSVYLTQMLAASVNGQANC